MKCTECIMDMPEGSRFCSYCGNPLTGKRHQIPTNSPSQPGGQQTTKVGFKRPSGNPVLTFQNKSTGVSFKMIRVDGGTFYKGLSPKNSRDDEQRHGLVTITSAINTGYVLHR